ncbi:MAG: hypothetical protein JO019_05045, partial [Candidatus Kaiserbacteria bacterium]|nr:hypothetical protein [Candidatus Kaiserbacteria bacterium]
MILDGRAIADEMYAALRARRSAIARKLSLGIIVAGENPVIEQFVRIKSRAAESLDIQMVRTSLPESASTEAVIEAVHDLAPRVDSLIVQLPLPKQVDVNAVLAEIPKEKDVDAINPRHAEDETH